MNSNRKYGIGGSNAEDELKKLQLPSDKPDPIHLSEYRNRIDRAIEYMRNKEIDALYLNAGTNLYYFTGTKWNPSERLVGAILLADGSLYYILPEFEIGTFKDFIMVKGELIPWFEHEFPVKKIIEIVGDSARLSVDGSTPFNLVSRFQEYSSLEVLNAEILIQDIRMIKSSTEIDQIQYAMDLTMIVHKAAAKILKPGITTTEVTDFIDRAHKKLGIKNGSYFCIVLFGRDSSFPHGVKEPKVLEEGDVVLVDTGCQYNGYISDITRTYSYGESSDNQRKIWNIEKKAQLIAFEASKPGNTCGEVDDEVREYLEKMGLGPGYELPGLPHRTGHGIGLEIHENPYILKGNPIEVKSGMSYSIEPMVVIPNQFGIRLEDHIYITEDGPNWFTEPAVSIENPFGM